MTDANREIEIKLAFDSPESARRCIETLGARVTTPRHFEDNRLYDQPDRPLKAAKKVLRLRRVGDRAILTYKAPVPGQHRHKVREEHETDVADVEAVARVFDGLGYEPVYRYQKYRTLYALEGLAICLDELPIGCFVELEGEPEMIDQVAERMGFRQDDYIQLTYRDLQEHHARARGVDEPGDMVFESH